MSARRKENPEEKENSQERWLVSYADFITLMFAFFAVLYATSHKDIEKSQEFQESIKKYLIKAGAFGESGSQINQGTKNNSPIESPIETFNPNKPETVKILDEAEVFIETQFTKAEQKKYILDLTADDWGVRIVIPSSALFSERSEKFREDAMPFINRLSELVAKSKRKVLIEGHVNQLELGAFRTTWEFASARSVNLLRFMQTKQKLPGSQLASASLGDTRPLLNDAPSQSNSRVEVILLNSEYEL